jgi:hypothetical protein
MPNAAVIRRQIVYSLKTPIGKHRFRIRLPSAVPILAVLAVLVLPTCQGASGEPGEPG